MSEEQETRVDRNWISDEQERILVAAHDRRFKTNYAGRYIIQGEKRPARRERERLMKRGMLKFRVEGEDAWWEPSARGYQALHDRGWTLRYPLDRGIGSSASAQGENR